MNKEKIIANIETYINTLNEEEQKCFKTVLDVSEKEHKKVKKVYKDLFSPILELAEIVQELRQEIKEQAQKDTKGNSYVKRSKLITKLLDKCYRVQFQTGFFEEMNGEKMQCCIIDAYYAFMFRNALDIPMWGVEGEPSYSVKKLIPDYRDFKQCEYDIAEIRTALKLHKAKKDKNPCIIELNNKCYNAEYFINVVDGLGGDVKMYQDPNEVRIDVFESENGIAILCPSKKNK